jgi:hypothetical protein
MSAFVDEATGEHAFNSVFTGTEDGDEQLASPFGFSIKDKLFETLQSQMLDPAGQRAYDDWDWSKVIQTDRDNVHLKLRWRPVRADSGITKVNSFKVDFTEAELEEEHQPLGPVCSQCMKVNCQNGANDDNAPLVPLKNVAVHPVPKPLIDSSTGRQEAALARRHALDQKGKVTGVLAVYVDRSKLHFGKNSPIPTMAVSVTRAAEEIGFDAIDQKRSDLPSPALSLKCRERNQHGSLEWGQTFYLPVSVGSDELQDGGLVLQLDLGGMKADPGLLGLGVGTWKKGKSGHGILALDAYDSYKNDVEVIAFTRYELKKVVDAGKDGISEKLILEKSSQESGKFWEQRKIANVGTVKVKFAWFPVS